MPRLTAAATAIAALLLATPASGAPGDLDASFNGVGYRIDQLGQADNEPRDAARQPDGKVVVVGGAGNGDWNVTRLNADGTLDTAFGGGDGTASFGLAFFGGTDDAAESVAIQPDGKIVVGGSVGLLTTSSICCSYQAGLVRLNADGSFDTTFSGDGRLTLGGTNDASGIFDVAVTGAGAIVAVRADEVVRYTPAGVLDTTFSGNGREEFPDGFTGAAVSADGDGRALVAGDASGDAGVRRYTTGGVLDTSFVGDGMQTVDLGGATEVEELTLAADGDIVLAGGVDGQMAVVRMDAAGAPDASFSGDGEATVDVTGAADVASDVAVDAADRVVLAGVAGRAPAVPGTAVATVRLNTQGGPDGTFAGDGILEESFGAPLAAGRALVLSDTAVLGVGLVDPAGAPADYGLVRYDAAGVPDPSFSVDGRLTLEAGEAFDAAREVVVQGDGKTVVVGDAVFGQRPPAGNDGRFGVVRYNADGSFDTGFGTGGVASVDFGSTASATDVALAPGGKIVVAGYLGSSGGEVAVARLNPDGSLDTTFAGDGRQTTPAGFDSARADAVALDGEKVVVAGRVRPAFNGELDVLVVRYTAAGEPDPAFSDDGIQTVDIGADDFGAGVAVGAAGEVVVGGSSRPSVGAPDDFAAVRLTAAGAPDATFSGDGETTVNLGAVDEGRGVALSGDRVVVAGGSGGDTAVLRLEADGDPDPTFSGDGIATRDLGGADTAEDLAVQADGAVVVAGAAQTGVAMAWGRFLATGDFDTALGSRTLQVGAADGAFGMALGSDTLVLAGATGELVTREFDFLVARYLLASGGTPATPTPTATATATASPTATATGTATPTATATATPTATPTYAIPTPTPPVVIVDPVAVLAPDLSGVKRSLRADAKRRVAIPIKCRVVRAGLGGACAGRIAVLVKKKPAGSARFAVPGTVRVKLAKKALRKSKVKAVVRAQVGSRTATKKVTIKRTKR